MCMYAKFSASHYNNFNVIHTIFDELRIQQKIPFTIKFENWK